RAAAPGRGGVYRPRRPGEGRRMKRTPLRRKTGISRKSGISRKTALPRKSTGKSGEVRTKSGPVRTPMRRQKPKVKTAQAKQRAALALRSGGRCEMETRLMPGIWARCGRWATDPAHVYTRPKCGRARDSVDVVIHA